MYNKFITTVTLIIVGWVVVGCAGKTMRYINPSTNFSYIKKVAILPLNNLSDDRFAAERVKNSLTVALLSKQVFDVIDQGEVTKIVGFIFREAGYEEGRAVPADRDTIKMIGERLGVQALIIGSVDDYSFRQSGNSVISLTLRMLDVSSGIILWETKVHEKGQSIWRNILGLGSTDKNELTRRVVNRALNTLI